MSKEQIELSIREAIPEDAPSLQQFLQKVSVQTPFLTEIEFPNTLEDQASSLARIYDSSCHALFLALDKDRVIGALSLDGVNEKNRGHVVELGIVVDEAYWGLGLGKILMEEADNWALENQELTRIELTVQERNNRALHLYQQCGYQKEGTLTYGVKVGEEYFNTVLMSKIIQ